MSSEPPPSQPPAYTQYGRSAQQSPPSRPPKAGLSPTALVLIVVGASLLGALLLCGGVAALAGLLLVPVHTTTIFGSIPSNPTSAQVPLAPTATPRGPHIITGATLGGTQAAFTAAFGESLATSKAPAYNFTLQDGTEAGVCFCGTQAGLDGQQHLDIMQFGPVAGVTWSQATTTAVTKKLMPPDAVYTRTIHDPDLGPILVYVSADLAKTFPANEFVDSNGGGALPAGTFSVACQRPGLAGCSMVTGT